MPALVPNPKLSCATEGSQRWGLKIRMYTYLIQSNYQLRCMCLCMYLQTSLTTKYRNDKQSLLLWLIPLCDWEASVCFQVYGYAMCYWDLISWADKQQLSPHKAHLNRQDDALYAIVAKLPANGPLVRALVSYKEDGHAAHCFVIGSNKSAKDLELIQDAERIRQFQKALMIDELLQWYRLHRWLVGCKLFPT